MFSHFYVGSMCLMRRLHLGRYNYMSIILALRLELEIA